MEVNMFAFIAQFTKNKCLMGRSVGPSATVVPENAKFKVMKEIFIFTMKRVTGTFLSVIPCIDYDYRVYRHRQLHYSIYYAF